MTGFEEFCITGDITLLCSGGNATRSKKCDDLNSDGTWLYPLRGRIPEDIKDIYITMQDDGNAVLYYTDIHDNSIPVWCTRTNDGQNRNRPKHSFGDVCKEREDNSYKFNIQAQPNKMISDFNITPTFSNNISDKCGIGFQPSFNPGNGSFGGKIGIRINF
jgi:hypothetical protein